MTGRFQKKSQRCNAVEEMLSELARAHGLRRARYRGRRKARLQNYFPGAACNAKRANHFPWPNVIGRHHRLRRENRFLSANGQPNRSSRPDYHHRRR